MTTMTVALALGAAQICAGMLMGTAAPAWGWTGLIVAAVVTLAAAWIGGASRGPAGPALVVVAQLAVCALVVHALWREWEDSRALGVDGVVFGILGIALLASAGVAFGAVLTWSRVPAQVGGLVVAGAFVLSGAGVTVAAAAATVSRVDCGRFHFDHGRWAAAGGVERPQIERTIAECRTLDGRTRAEVGAMLGPVMQGHGKDLAGGLEITYDAAGRVVDVRTPYESD